MSQQFCVKQSLGFS